MDTDKAKKHQHYQAAAQVDSQHKKETHSPLRRNKVASRGCA
jgi:hypothetical protein